MTEPDSIQDVINLWPRRSDLSEDLRAVGLKDVTPAQIGKWALRSSIAAQYHFGIIQAGKARGFPVTAELLARLHDLRRREGDAA